MRLIPKKGYLLDTCVLLYWAKGTKGIIAEELRKILEDLENPVYVSAMSMWEIAIKRQKDQRKNTNKLEMSDEDFVTLSEIIDNQLLIIPLEKPNTKIFSQIIDVLETADPFDHMIVSQAIERDLELITNDTKIMNAKQNLKGFKCYAGKIQ